MPDITRKNKIQTNQKQYVAVSCMNCFKKKGLSKINLKIFKYYLGTASGNPLSIQQFTIRY